jgi:hypothetical protein
VLTSARRAADHVTPAHAAKLRPLLRFLFLHLPYGFYIADRIHTYMLIFVKIFLMAKLFCRVW